MLNTETKMFLTSFFAIIISMVAIDAFWLGFMLKRFYTPQIGHLLSDSVQFTPAILFYVLYAAALNIFVVSPGITNHTGYTQLLLLGMLFGLVTYGTYDLTNQATLKNWPWVVTLVDLLWGSSLTGVVTLIATYCSRFFNG